VQTWDALLTGQLSCIVLLNSMRLRIMAKRVVMRVREYIYRRSNSVEGSNVDDDTQKAPAVTDPYRPPVGAASSKDIQFVAKSYEELPAGSVIDLGESKKSIEKGRLT